MTINRSMFLLAPNAQNPRGQPRHPRHGRRERGGRASRRAYRWLDLTNARIVGPVHYNSETGRWERDE